MNKIDFAPDHECAWPRRLHLRDLKIPSHVTKAVGLLDMSAKSVWRMKILDKSKHEIWPVEFVKICEEPSTARKYNILKCLEYESVENCSSGLRKKKSALYGTAVNTLVELLFM